MTETDLVDLTYERVGSSKKEAGEVVEAVFAIIRESLRNGGKVKISGFGTFIVNHKHARRGRNPQTGALTVVIRRLVAAGNYESGEKSRVLRFSAVMSPAYSHSRVRSFLY